MSNQKQQGNPQPKKLTDVNIKKLQVDKEKIVKSGKIVKK